jgi:hypothetical protein
LHDGAPVGYRLNEHGQERPVFNVLELFEPSRYCTYEAAVDVGTAEEFQELERLCESAGSKSRTGLRHLSLCVRPAVKEGRMRVTIGSSKSRCLGVRNDGLGLRRWTLNP